MLTEHYAFDDCFINCVWVGINVYLEQLATVVESTQASPKITKISKSVNHSAQTL